MAKHEDDLTLAEAEGIVEKHEKQHGRDMSDKAGDLATADEVPSDAERDDPPGWVKQGKARPTHPDD